MMLALFVNAAFAATLTVGPNGDYTTIQNAVDSAQSGDIIQVAAGTYVEQVTVDRPDLDVLTIRGPSTQRPEIVAPNSKVVTLVARDVHLTLENLRVTASASAPSAQRAIRLRTLDDDNADETVLTVANVLLTGPTTSGTLAVNCMPEDAADAVVVEGSGLSFSGWDLLGETTCVGYTQGWDIDD